MFLRSAYAVLRQAKAGAPVAQSVAAAGKLPSNPQLLALAATQVQVRNIGSWIPEFWGKKSKYTEGTEFLGTPKNHLDLVKKRPLSPDLFSIDGSGTHYKMPVAALSSITNRVTGVGMTGGMLGLGMLSLSGSDPMATIECLKAAYPLLVPVAKAGITFPLVYHYLAGVRHLVWDTYHIGNQTHKSLLDKDAVESSSNALFAGSIALSGVIACL
uniref:Succinate dehydrogenase subunit C n=1 Tax=Chloropicon laureae TaxID=464258 RepID=A0A7S3E539_9CHLO|mmetsp:Transcript_6948/g.17956  ORF Transcript_6948/g.17956 Transcript_6948/m.17956 type:complete len:214 (+) Transcript_6948:106-747(+)